MLIIGASFLTIIVTEVGRNWWTGTNEVSIAINIINSSDVWEDFTKLL